MASDEIEKLVEDRIAKTEAYNHGYGVGKRDGYTQGRADALKELEQLQREAFESGHNAKVRQEYNSALIENGFAAAAGWYKDVDEAFGDYLKSKEGA